MIAKLLHEGEKISQLKSVIKYNTVAKEYLNSINNPRLLQATSNLGIIDITDEDAYQYFMNEFIDEICLNKSLSANKRQKKLYAHEVISFEDQDNKNHTQNELAQIAIETLNNLYDMETTPYIIWPQRDSGRLHFHIVRSQFNNQGIYQRVKNSKLKMRQSCERIEKKYNLTLTGKNVSNDIKPVNDPMLKVFKNLKIEAEYNHKKNIVDAINQDTTIGSIKRKTHNLLMNDTYQNQDELKEQKAYQTKQQTLNAKESFNTELEVTKSTIFAIYKNAKDEDDFIKQIELNNITIELLKHSKSGKKKGIVFHYKDQVISGGKVSSSMTLGKIKNRYPNFITSFEKPPIIHCGDHIKKQYTEFNIEQINNYYKQRKTNNNGDILIYFGKKNIKARPYNYNLKLSQSRDKIRFGPSTPNDFDLSLSIDIALKNSWKSAILTNSDPAFLKRMMKAAYKKDPALLFFVKSDKEHQLSYVDLKEIKNNLTSDDLKKALQTKLISEKDLHLVHQDLIQTLKNEATSSKQKGYILALQKGFSLEVLDQKTQRQLEHYAQYDTFKEINKDELLNKEKNKIELKKQEETAFLNEIRTEVKNALTNHLIKEKPKYISPRRK